jgi:hypothetical protein
MSNKQDHAETWVIGDYTMHVTHFEQDEFYEWTVTYAPMGYSMRGQSVSLDLAIRNMLDTAENHSGGVLLFRYHFDMPGQDVEIECAPQTTVEDAFRKALVDNHIRVPYEDWVLESVHGIRVDNMSLHIGVFYQGLIAYTNAVSA